MHDLALEKTGRLGLMPRALVTVCLICLPWSATWSSLTGHDLARVAQAALGSACALWLLLSPPARLPMGKASGLLALLLCCLAAAATLGAPHVWAALRELTLFAGMVAIAWVCSRVVKPVWLIRVGAVSSAAYAAVFLVVALLAAATANTPEDHRHLFTGYDNYRFLNHVQTVTLPLLIAATVTAVERGRWLKLAWFAHITGWMLLFFTMGRGTLLGLAVGATVVGLLLRDRARSYLQHMLVGVLAGAGTKVVLTWWLPAWGDVVPSLGLTGQLSDARSAYSRFGLWELALNYIGESPWFGIGPMHYANRPNVEAAHPHNIYLQVAAEWGVPMLAGSLAAALWALWTLGQAVRCVHSPGDRAVGAALLMACCAVMVDGGFSGNFVMPMSQLWIAVLIGVAWGWTHSQPLHVALDECRTPTKQHRFVTRLAAVAMMSLQLWLWFSISPDLLDLNAHLVSISDKVALSTRLSPRFWSNGWF